MYLTFELTCPRCGRHARCEAPAGGPDPERVVRWECPRCRQTLTARAADGRAAAAPTPWAVRAAA